MVQFSENAVQPISTVISHPKVETHYDTIPSIASMVSAPDGAPTVRGALDRRRTLDHLRKWFHRMHYLVPYNHSGIGEAVLRNWNPFLENPDNGWICQSLVLSHCRVANQKQCFLPKRKLIDFYTALDMSLGQYLHRLFDRKPCPNPRCKEPLSAHSLTYSHHHKIVTVQLTDEPHLSAVDGAKYDENDKSPIHRRGYGFIHLFFVMLFGVGTKNGKQTNQMEFKQQIDCDVDKM